MIVMLKKNIALLALAASAFSLSSCASSTTPHADNESDSSTLTVSASFYPTAFLAERVGGDRVSVTSVTPADVEPHEYELSPAEVATLGKQKLIVYVSGFQPSLDEAIHELSLADGVAIDLAGDVDLIPFGTDVHGHDDGDADAHEAESQEAEGEDVEAESHEEHNHGAYDPHFWLDPERMSKATDAVARALSTADPEGAETYEANANELKKELQNLDADFSDALMKPDPAEGTPSKCKSNVVITPHSAFGYMAAAYGLEAHAISLDAESEPSPARIAELAEGIKKEGATAIFAETRASTASIEALAEVAKVDVGELNPIELKPADGDYLTAMRANLEALKKGLHCD